MSNNLLTSCWGPVGWAFLHSVTFSYPEVPTKEDANAYQEYFSKLGDVLPCDKCKKNYRKNLAELPIGNFLGSRKDLAYWGYLLHEKVNDELGVKERLKFEDVWRHYESMRSEGCGREVGVCSDPSSKKRCRVQYVTDKENFENAVFNKNWPFVVAIVFLIVIIIVLLLTRIKPRR